MFFALLKLLPPSDLPAFPEPLLSLRNHLHQRDHAGREPVALGKREAHLRRCRQFGGPGEPGPKSRRFGTEEKVEPYRTHQQ